eukprot:TRINITY_DN67321_c6_g12_i2.p1 TRINITY_DN67321_c6_g12~~TRINITY_DN67321_c6_g12_i2.p1  ORF type:complete len:333 (-),score=11.93 TRINITY_DN67321_c6_g12_i2:470-1468(-)
MAISQVYSSVLIPAVSLVLVCTSMMRSNGRRERGLDDGLTFLDKVSRRLKGSVAPIKAVISGSADPQECAARGVDLVELFDRTKFQRRALALLNKGTNRSWRRLRNTPPLDCQGLVTLASNYKRLLLSCGVPSSSFEKGTDHCFCSTCEPFPVWPRGGEKYMLPTGWYRLGLAVRKEFHKRRAEIEQWPVAFHGTSDRAVGSIIHHRRIMFPGDTLDDGTTLPCKLGQTHADTIPGGGPVIYLSPTIAYCCAPWYSEPFVFNDKVVQIAFQVRVKPGSYHKRQETLGGQWLDPLNEVPGSELEWVVNDRTAAVPYGLLFRELGSIAEFGMFV